MSKFPGIIKELPQANIPVRGLESYLFQGEDKQVLFMEFKADAVIEEHSHEAQWGVVLDGEIELCIDGTKKVFRQGDEYFIPQGVKHSAIIKAGYRDVTLFNQRDRYNLL